MTAGQLWYLDNEVWVRRGSPNVRPGELPPVVNPQPGGAKFQISELVFSAGTPPQPHAPVVNLQVSPLSGTPPLAVSISWSATDPDGGLQTVTLNYGDGSATVSLNAAAGSGTQTHTYTNSGTYRVTVTATDSGGLSTSAQVDVTASATPLGTGSTYCGACLAKPGGSSLAGATGVVTKWGKGASIRQFAGTDTSGPYHPSGASVVHTSWNLDDASVANGSLDNTIAAMAARAKSGDIMDLEHERDNDTDITNSSGGAAAIALYVKAKNRFYDVVKATNPNVLVAFTVTAGFWYNATSDSWRDQFITNMRGDLFGFDYDGVHDKDDAGPDYDVGAPTTEIANMKRYLSKYKANHWQGFTVPEFGTSRRPWDTSGQPRADWFAAGADELIKGGAYAIMVFDYNTPYKSAASPGHDYVDDYNELKVGTPEYTLWRKYVATNPA